MGDVSETATIDDGGYDSALEETLLAACADRDGASAIPESLTERLFFVREQMERTSEAPPEGACLLASGPGMAPTWFAAVDGWSVGRESSCSLVLSDNRVSRMHARLERDGDDWLIRDLDSQNGMRVNGTRTRQQLLRSGDVVEIADFAIIFMD